MSAISKDKLIIGVNINCPDPRRTGYHKYLLKEKTKRTTWSPTSSIQLGTRRTLYIRGPNPLLTTCGLYSISRLALNYQYLIRTIPILNPHFGAQLHSHTFMISYLGILLPTTLSSRLFALRCRSSYLIRSLILCLLMLLSYLPP